MLRDGLFNFLFQLTAAAMNAWAAIVDSIVSGSSKDKETSHQPSQELNSRLMNLAR